MFILTNICSDVNKFIHYLILLYANTLWYNLIKYMLGVDSMNLLCNIIETITLIFTIVMLMHRVTKLERKIKELENK